MSKTFRISSKSVFCAGLAMKKPTKKPLKKTLEKHLKNPLQRGLFFKMNIFTRKVQVFFEK
jgi:hypothetical protein